MKFSDIAGHAGPAARLRRAVDTDRVAGAYLLAGPVGIGKRRLADAFATSLLCDAPEDGNACGTCPQCVRVEGRSHADLLVLTRDEDRRDIRTDQVRELIRWYALRPLMAPRKVALIDGAEQLNDHGQNALLKTLEEPRGQGVLVLVAAIESAILPTVRSRCQIVRCDPLSADVVRDLLVARGVARARAEVLAAQGRGSLARALAGDDEAHGRLRALVLGAAADLPRQTAADLSALAQEMSKAGPESGLGVLLSWYRDLLGRILDAPTPLENPDRREQLARLAPARDVARTLRQLGLVCDTVRTVERNANRTLALETLLLALRDIEWTNSPPHRPR